MYLYFRTMSYDDLFHFDGNKNIFEDYHNVTPDNLLNSEEFSEEITDVFEGLEEGCRSELSSLSDSDSKNSVPPEKPIRKQLVVGSHIKVIEDGNHKYTCTICNCSFSRKQQVRYHDYCVTGKRPLKCELCGKGFVKRSHLTYHVRTHTGESPFKCSICHKGFKQKTKLTRHERTHEIDSRLVCRFCKKSYSDKDSLRKHEQKHSENVYKCPTCKKSYTDKFTLKHHLSVHKSPNYVCDVCGKSFLRKNSLNVHMQIHEGNYPFECGSCHQTFRNRKELKHHNVVHDKDNPGHECEICSITCGRRDNLLRHIRNCHLDPCPKKISNDPKDSSTKAINLRDHPKKISKNGFNSDINVTKRITSKDKTNELSSEESSTTQLSKNSQEKNNLTELIETFVSDKSHSKSEKSCISSIVKDDFSNDPSRSATVMRKKVPKIDLLLDTIKVNTKPNSYSHKGIHQNSDQATPHEIMQSNFSYSTAGPSEVKSISESKRAASKEQTSEVRKSNSETCNYGRITALSNQSDQIDFYNFSNKSTVINNGVTQEASVIKHTDAFKDSIIVANMLREPVIKNLRVPIVLTNDLTHVLNPD